MNEYSPETPRTVIACAAAALCALTLGVFVVLPATFDSGFDPELTLAAARPASTQPVEVTISPARIDVVATREPNVAWALTEPSKPCKPTV